MILTMRTLVLLAALNIATARAEAQVPELTDLRDFAVSLTSQRGNLLSGMEMDLSSEQWDISNSQLQQIKDIIAKHSAFGVLITPSDVVVREIRDFLGWVPLQTWHVLAVDGSLRFTMAYDPKSMEMAKAHAVVQTLQQEWLFTDTTVYSVVPDQKTVSVEPLDPNSRSYPLSLDVVAFPFGLVLGANALMKDMYVSDLTHRILASHDNPYLKLWLCDSSAFRIYKVAFRPPADAGFGFSRYYLFSDSKDKMDTGLFLPSLALDIVQQTKESYSISLYQIIKSNIGPMSRSRLTLTVPQSFKVKDLEVPQRILKDQ